MQKLVLGMFILGSSMVFGQSDDTNPFECKKEALQIAKSLDSGGNQESYSIEYKYQKRNSARIIVSLGGEGLDRVYDVRLKKHRKEDSGNGGATPQQVACFFESAQLLD